MRRVILALIVGSCLMASGCFTKWADAPAAYPVIPVGEYPEYVIPEKVETEEDVALIVDALFKAEKHAMELRKKVEVYNRFAEGKNAKAKDLYK